MKTEQTREAWNKGKLVGQKPPLRPKDVWAIRIHLQAAHAVRDLALFNLAIDSKLRGCDLVSLRVRDVTHGNQVLPRAQVIQRKTQRPIQFELNEPTRSAVRAWIETAALRSEQYLFPSRLLASPHLSTRQYARMIRRWAGAAGLDPTVYGTHSMGRTKATLIYKRTKNLRAVQLLLGHSKVESTIRYLGIFSMPAILKGWIERVYAYGFGYGVGEHSDQRWGSRYGEGTLAGKRAMLVVTAGGWESHYGARGVNGPIDDLLFPIHHGVLYYPGFDVLPPFLVYRTGRMDETRFAATREALGERLDTLWSTAPIAFRPQNAGAYEIPALTLRDEIAPGSAGFAAHVCRN